MSIMPSFGINLSNGSKDAARNSSMNADTDIDNKSVVVEENKNQMQEEEEQFITLVNNKKSITHEKGKSKSILDLHPPECGGRRGRFEAVWYW